MVAARAMAARKSHSGGAELKQHTDTTRSLQLAEQDRCNERLKKYIAEIERNHKVEMEFLNSRLIQASNVSSSRP